MQQNKWMQNNGRRRVHRMYCNERKVTKENDNNERRKRN